jgi:hypothetical protein
MEPMRRFLKENGLTLTLLVIFAGSLIGQAIVGWHAYDIELRQHGQAPSGFATYLTSGHFLSAVFENWESEFLQMAAYVLLTAWLFQKGSPESKSLEGDNPEDEIKLSDRGKHNAPWPAHKGGLVLRLYSHSLGAALTLLFVGSFLAHGLASHRRTNEEALLHNRPPTSLGDTFMDAEFWYESFQNWQSEFLSIAVLLILSIYLRERGSPESKPVAAPHAETGH